MKWEYKTLPWEGFGQLNREDYHQELEKVLNAYGTLGWELAFLIFPRVIVFKRRIKKDST